VSTTEQADNPQSRPHYDCFPSCRLVSADNAQKSHKVSVSRSRPVGLIFPRRSSYGRKQMKSENELLVLVSVESSTISNPLTNFPRIRLRGLPSRLVCIYIEREALHGALSLSFAHRPQSLLELCTEVDDGESSVNAATVRQGFHPSQHLCQA
jgi:hypothetical protein